MFIKTFIFALLYMAVSTFPLLGYATPGNGTEETCNFSIGKHPISAGAVLTWLKTKTSEPENLAVKDLIFDRKHVHWDVV